MTDDDPMSSFTSNGEDTMQPPLGSGQRFASLKASLAAKPGIKNPGALAAWIGRRKFGAAKMGAMSAAGRARAK